MREYTIDNTISYSKSIGLKLWVFGIVFLMAGGFVIQRFDSYVTDFWKIRACKTDGFARGDFMTACGPLKVDRYAFGSIYLKTQKNAVRNAEDADVLIFGNSRTMRSFSTNAIDNYFGKKGLTYMVLASEGASYVGINHTARALNMKPKIVMINNEILSSNRLSDAFSDLIYNPDKYKTRFSYFYAAQALQKWSCESDVKVLKDFYCKGTIDASWRSATTGRFVWDYVSNPEEDIPINVDPDFKLGSPENYVPHAKDLLKARDFKDACRVLYLVNSPLSAPNLMHTVAEQIDAQSVYVDVEGLKTYDKSHLDRPNSERWAQEFVKALDPAIDNCIREKNISVNSNSTFVETPYNVSLSQDGQYLDRWDKRFSMKTDNAFAIAPDGTQTADRLSWDGSNRLQKVFRKTPIEAGTKISFSAMLWADEPATVRMLVIRSCSAKTPMERHIESFKVTTEPTEYRVDLTVENDHKCAAASFSGVGAAGSVYAWNGKVTFAYPDGRLVTK